MFILFFCSAWNIQIVDNNIETYKERDTQDEDSSPSQMREQNLHTAYTQDNNNKNNNNEISQLQTEENFFPSASQAQKREFPDENTVNVDKKKKTH